jgi:hypothetical protein
MLVTLWLALSSNLFLFKSSGFGFEHECEHNFIPIISSHDSNSKLDFENWTQFWLDVIYLKLESKVLISKIGYLHNIV